MDWQDELKRRDDALAESAGRNRRLVALVATQAARIADLEAALAPFTVWAERWDDGRPGEHRVDARNLADDLRRARAALASERKQDGGSDGD